jgi:hypothetical protein
VGREVGARVTGEGERYHMLRWVSGVWGGGLGGPSVIIPCEDGGYHFSFFDEHLINLFLKKWQKVTPWQLLNER